MCPNLQKLSFLMEVHVLTFNDWKNFKIFHCYLKKMLKILNNL